MGDLLGFVDESSQHKEDIFLEVELFSISIRKQGDDSFLYFWDMDGNKIVVFAHFGQNIPSLVDGHGAVGIVFFYLVQNENTQIVESLDSEFQVLADLFVVDSKYMHVYLTS